MPTTYEECGDDVTCVVNEMMEKYHGELLKVGVSIECLYAIGADGKPAMKTRDGKILAQIKIANLERRTQGHADAQIKIDKTVWEEMAPQQRKALIDHELEHLVLVTTPEGTPKRDDLGRPKLKCKPHDWALTGFASVVARHKEAACECEEMVKFITSEDGQMVMSFKDRG